MKSIALVVLTGFLTLSVFGFLGMLESTDMAHAPNTCLASLAQNGACPPPEDTVDSAIFHTDALKAFTTTLVTQFVALASLTILLAAMLAVFLPFLAAEVRTVADTVAELVAHIQAVQHFRLALIRFEHSPTAYERQFVSGTPFLHFVCSPLKKEK